MASNTTNNLRVDDTEDVTNTTSLFLSSLLVNLMTFLACTMVFSFVRNLDRFRFVYRPREDNPDVEVKPPSSNDSRFSWFFVTLQTSEEQLLRTAGLDAVMVIRFFIFGLQLFSFSSFLGLVIVLPVNWTGERDLVGFDGLSMAKVDNASPRLWCHGIIFWVINCSGLAFLYINLQDYAVLRVQYLCSNCPSNQTVLVRGIPDELPQERTEELALGLKDRLLAIKDDLLATARSLIPVKIGEEKQTCSSRLQLCDSYFRSLYGDAVLFVTIAPRAVKLDAILSQRDGAIVGVNRAQEAKEKGKSTTVLAKSEHKVPIGLVDGLTHFPEQVTKLTKEYLSARDEVVHAPAMDAAFVCFRDLYHVSVASQLRHTDAPNTFQVMPAPEPRDLLWSNLDIPLRSQPFRNLVVVAAIVGLVFGWTIPVAFALSLAQLSRIATAVPFLEPVINFSPALRGFLEGYLPAVIVAQFFRLLARLCGLLTRTEGAVSKSAIELGVLRKMFTFWFVNLFLVTLLGSALNDSMKQISERPLDIFNILGTNVPKMGNFFTSFAMIKSLSSFSFSLLMVPDIFMQHFQLFRAKSEGERDEIKAGGPYSYGETFSEQLIMLVVGLTYSVVAPIVAPFILIFFALGYLVTRHHLMYVHVKEFETGGLFWPLVYNRIIASFFISQVTMIGIFLLKAAWGQVFLTLTLPLFTGLFVQHASKCMSTSLPLDMASKKDVGADLTELHEAYVHPSLNVEGLSPLRPNPCVCPDAVDTGSVPDEVQTSVVPAPVPAVLVSGESGMQTANSSSEGEPLEEAQPVDSKEAQPVEVEGAKPVVDETPPPVLDHDALQPKLEVAPPVPVVAAPQPVDKANKQPSPRRQPPTTEVPVAVELAGRATTNECVECGQVLEGAFQEIPGVGRLHNACAYVVKRKHQRRKSSVVTGKDQTPLLVSSENVGVC